MPKNERWRERTAWLWAWMYEQESFTRKEAEAAFKAEFNDLDVRYETQVYEYLENLSERRILGFRDGHFLVHGESTRLRKETGV